MQSDSGSRSRVSTWAIATLMLTLITLMPGGAVLAQESPPLTPVPIDRETPACTAEPANLARVLEIAGSAVNDPDAVVGFEPPVTGGEITTGADADAVIALMGQLIACINAEDAGRFIGLFSDAFIKRAAYDIAGLVEDAQAAEEEREPADGTGDVEESDAAELTIIVSTSDVYAQPDGRLAYSAAIGSAEQVNSDNIPIPSSVIQIIAAEQRGEWKIDDLREASLDDQDGPTDCASNGADGCAATPAGAGAGYVEGEGYAGWLMPVEASEEAASWLLSIDEDTATPFQPNAAEVGEAEAALRAFIADHPNATERLIEELDTGFYTRQYLGFTTPGGAILVINAYCGEPFGNPAVDVEIVSDGGDCYWQAIYNLTAGEFTNLSVNGEA